MIVKHRLFLYNHLFLAFCVCVTRAATCSTSTWRRPSTCPCLPAGERS